MPDHLILLLKNDLHTKRPWLIISVCVCVCVYVCVCVCVCEREREREIDTDYKQGEREKETKEQSEKLIYTFPPVTRQIDVETEKEVQRDKDTRVHRGRDV